MWDTIKQHAHARVQGSRGQMRAEMGGNVGGPGVEGGLPICERNFLKKY